ncbi:MAG TPA: hypothetical protein VIW92_02520 [Thermoanaerobaculia bacterium]
MRTKYALLALVPVGLVLQLGSAGAAPNRALGVRWEGTVEPLASKIVIHNLSPRAANAFLGSRVVSVPADGAAEMGTAGLGAGPLQLRSSAHMLLVQAGDDFDSGSLEIARSAAVQPGQAKLLPRFGRPDWTRELVTNGPNVRHGATGAVSVKSDDPTARVEVAVEFVAPHSSVRIRQLDTLGNEVTSFVAAASKPVQWRASLGPVNGESRVELQTLRGESQGTAAALLEGDASPVQRAPIAPVLKAGGGILDFDPEINWQFSPNLYARITGAPPSMCGDLYISRNNSPYSVSPGYFCTDASGNATRGPWSWGNQAGDETAYAYVIWANGLSTNTARHVWDKTGPTVSITSPMASPAPISFSGTGSDGVFGAGFSPNWGSYCVTYFYNTTTSSYWWPNSGYINTFPYNGPNCTISGMPSHSITWSEGQIPPGFAHVRGHCYEWGVYLHDANGGYTNQFGWTKINFCV